MSVIAGRLGSFDLHRLPHPLGEGETLRIRQQFPDPPASVVTVSARHGAHGVRDRAVGYLRGLGPPRQLHLVTACRYPNVSSILDPAHSGQRGARQRPHPRGHPLRLEAGRSASRQEPLPFAVDLTPRGAASTRGSILSTARGGSLKGLS